MAILSHASSASSPPAAVTPLRCDVASGVWPCTKNAWLTATRANESRYHLTRANESYYHGHAHQSCATTDCQALWCDVPLNLSGRGELRLRSWCGWYSALRNVEDGAALGAGGATLAASRLLRVPTHAAAWRRFLGAVMPEADRPRAQSSPWTARVIALGGSMTAGNDCHDQTLGMVHTPLCAFPRRLVTHLETVSGGRVDWRSHAVGGTSTLGQLPSLPLIMAEYEAERALPTLILVDFSANDILSSSPDARDDGPSAFLPQLEAFYSYLLRAHPHAALLMVESFFGAERNSGWPAAYRAVADHYGVPHVRYADAVRDGRLAWGLDCPWPRPTPGQAAARPRSTTPGSASSLAPPAVLDEAEEERREDDGQDHYQCRAHAPWTTHQLIADVLLASLAQLWGALAHRESGAAASSASVVALPRPLVPPTTEGGGESLQVCSPLESYLATQRFESGAAAGSVPGVRVTRGDWALVEDRRGKPGWVGTANGSTIEFDLRFGKTPRVAFVYLQGYTRELAEVRVKLVRVRPVDANASGAAWGRLADDAWVVKPPWLRNVCMLDAQRVDGVNVTQSQLAQFTSDDRMYNYAMDRTLTRALTREVPPRHPGRPGTRLGHSAGSLSGPMGFGMPKDSAAALQVELYCRAPPCKFKVLSVSSC